MAFASQTSVTVAESVADIQKIIARHGGKVLRCEEWNSGGICEFVAKNTKIRFVLEYRVTKSAMSHAPERRDQEHRAHWRALFLTIKAKFVSVETGIESFHEAFMGRIVQADDSVAVTKYLPQILKNSITEANGWKKLL